MEGSILIALRSRVNPVLSCAQLTEILGCPEKKKEVHFIGRWMVRRGQDSVQRVLGDDVTEQLHFQSACGRFSDVDVHKNDWSLCS